MASILIQVTTAVVADPSRIRVIGLVSCEGTQAEWLVELPFSVSAADINEACVTAAIAKMSARGVEVLDTDTKRLFGGALPNLS